ncbi:hypothetical protein Y032_0160g3346 [Ancylostoma ceylanicum]|uniref:Uncharacterized protein n=1 Tax=Ancylostoma ceylanicum TaxID=53326 RepID=A0A016SYC0_9BILA|nr:hypothetical protein Y032_0160g3346 [Ancylostoma ceylanicum]
MTIVTSKNSSVVSDILKACLMCKLFFKIGKVTMSIRHEKDGVGSHSTDQNAQLKEDNKKEKKAVSLHLF